MEPQFSLPLHKANSDALLAGSHEDHYDTKNLKNGNLLTFVSCYLGRTVLDIWLLPAHDITSLCPTPSRRCQPRTELRTPRHDRLLLFGLPLGAR